MIQTSAVKPQLGIVPFLLKEETVMSAYITKLNAVKARLESLNPDDIKDIDNAPPLEWFWRGMKSYPIRYSCPFITWGY